MRRALVEELHAFVGAWPPGRRASTRWGRPLVGVASAGDPLFPELKRVASPSHLLPDDLLAGAGAVVTFFLPFERSVGLSNISGDMASAEWATAYIETNELIRAVCAYMKGWLEAAGYRAAVTPPTHDFDDGALMSAWSHRHVAFVAGLGRFGLNNMLITEAGCCGRLGSFVTSLELEPDIRATAEACLYRHDGSCHRCVTRCVGDALFTDRFDRRACYDVCLRNERLHASLGAADVCGKCLVAVPCAFVDPVARRIAKNEPSRA